MKAPRYATITISLDTERYRQDVRPETKDGQVAYLLNRLLSGEEVAESEFAFVGMKVSAREAVKPEILGTPARNHSAGVTLK